MKSSTLKSVVILFVFLINNCDSNNHPTEFNSNPEDIAIKQKLIGTWKVGSYYISFHEDGTYIDSTYISPIPHHPGDTIKICREIELNGLVLDKVTEGFYIVKNGLLKKQPLRYIFDCRPLEAPAAYIYYDKLIEINEDTLKLTTMFSYDLIDGEPDDIWGTWRRSFWAWSFHISLPATGAPEMIIETMTFNPDSLKYRQELEGLPYENVVFYRPFNYNPPLLERTDEYKFFDVSFQKDKMFWLQKNRKRTYIRQN